jgi:ATP-dependent DNA ligase
MTLPLQPPVQPQLAKTGKAMPTGEGWAYEPKWDGFRVIAFVDGDEVYLQSRGAKPLHRYFPELCGLKAGRYVLDGEIVIVGADGSADFETLQQRIHPAESRIERLSKETPAVIYAFDLLAEGDESLLGLPFAERRERLQAYVQEPVRVTPLTTDPAEAEERWLDRTEGVIAKELSAPYRPGSRTGMVKVKRVRTIDCVVVGWRPGKHEGTVGSLILGLYAPDGQLHVVGHSSGISAADKKALVARLAPYETGQTGTGEASRWDGDRELEWRSLRPELVVEITYDTKSPGRIRHGTKILRWRDDKAPEACSLDQLT